MKNGWMDRWVMLEHKSCGLSDRLLSWNTRCCYLMAGLPPWYGHLQGSVGGEECGLQGQVGHRTGFTLAPEPALNGNPLVGVTICRESHLFICSAATQGWATEKHFVVKPLSIELLPAAMTGSSISSLVIGHRNSSGMSEPLSLALSASILRRRRPRRPTDSEEQDIAKFGFASKMEIISYLNLVKSPQTVNWLFFRLFWRMTGGPLQFINAEDKCLWVSLILT